MERLRPLIIAALMALAIGGALQATGALSALEHDTIDARFSLREDRTSDDVLVVAVDDVTFNDLGVQWPFKRSVFGRAITRLDAAGARDVIFDIQFTEPTTDKEDWALYDATDRAGGAVFATSESDGRGGHNVFGGEDKLRAIGATGAASNLPDEDAGVVRRFNHDIDRLGTVATKVAERAGRKPPRSAFHSDGTAWIDFRGGPGTIDTVSFSELVRGRVPESMIRGRIVVVGASAPTLQDLHPTSTARRELMSGPEIQANAILTALEGNPLRSAPWWVGGLSILLLAVLVPLTALRLSPLSSCTAGIVAGAAYLGAAYLAFLDGTVVAVVAPMTALLAATVTTTVVGQLYERAERHRVDAVNELLEAAVRERTADLDALQLEIIERLGQAVDSRDEETGEHINRITTLSHNLAKAIGLDPDRAEMLRRASAMHDVGKVAIPDRILQHPGPLTPDERRIMETHTTIGAKILAGSRSPLVNMAEVIALTHHEKFNGLGYPRGLAGEAIPLEGRIVAVCDVYDALISRRPYKEAWTPEAALAEIEAGSGSHFDPRLATAFVAMMRAELAAAPTTEPAVALAA